ncbi:GAF domain-containing sensor histidine kinase [Crocosphaera sp. Alani8]|uniref:GAF domain-containing sensor histidine kinase n=1 Tax=Crocosphaera sp. Alani8 TaxID=3038952 RepID=UPI00313B052E
MSSATANIPNPGQDFIALCRSQVELLAKTLQADWCAVYLTSEEEGNAVSLIPVVVYPFRDTIQSPEQQPIRLREGKQEITLSNLYQGLPNNLDRYSIFSENGNIDTKDYQIVLPLIYKEVVLGILVTQREANPWESEEFGQVQQIADTIAIACLLDQHQEWYRRQLQQQQLQQQQERDRLDDLFHQIRNPLTALKVFGKLLLKRLGVEDQNRSIVSNILGEGEHLQQLIKDFESGQKSLSNEEEIITLTTDSVAVADGLSLSLPASKSLSLTQVFVWDILETVVISAESIAENKDIDLRVIKTGNLDPVLANVSALREVLSNLIDNSIKYTPASGKVTIEFGLSRTINNRKYQGISIEDTGYGIPLKDQEHIFERHYRGVQSDGDISGSGLGLAIVKELIDQMGGVIELFSPVSNNNKGTRFIVWLVGGS